jgi:hypothetical protein
MNLDTQEFSKQVNDCRRRAGLLAADLTSQQLLQRPDPAKWSVADCLSHLTVTGSLVQKIARKDIANARQNNVFGKGPFSTGPRGRVLIWVAEPPPKFRIPAPKGLVPRIAGDGDKVLEDFMAVQDGWESLLRDAEGLDLYRIKIGKLLSPFRCRLSGGLLWMMAHQRRHLCQAENVKNRLTGDAGRAAAG